MSAYSITLNKTSHLIGNAGNASNANGRGSHSNGVQVTSSIKVLSLSTISGTAGKVNGASSNEIAISAGIAVDGDMEITTGGVSAIGGDAPSVLGESYGIKVSPYSNVKMNVGWMVAKATSGTKMVAISKKPIIKTFGYHWRTSENGVFTKEYVGAYIWSESQSYFELQEYSQEFYLITVKADEGGSISPSSNFTTVEGYSEDFTITADENYVIRDVTLDGISVKDQLVNGVYTIPVVTSAHTIHATFTLTKFPLTVNGGTGSGNYEKGTTVTITANSAPVGKRFKLWKLTSGGGTLVNAYSATTDFTMPSGGATVTAVYENISTKMPPENSGTPQTGDNSNLILWLALFLVSGGILGTVMLRFKKTYK